MVKLSLKQEDIAERMVVIKEIDHAKHFMYDFNQCVPEEKIAYILSLGTFYDFSINEEKLCDLLATIKKYKRKEHEEIRILWYPFDSIFLFWAWLLVLNCFFKFVSFYHLPSYVYWVVALLYFICSCMLFLYVKKKNKIKEVLLQKGLNTEALSILAWNKDNKIQKEINEKKYYHFSTCINCGDPIRITDEEIEIDEKLFEQRITEWHQILQKYLNDMDLEGE
ncbi:TPA: hypothetical protein ACOBV7_003009 [Enterococcus faecium]